MSAHNFQTMEHFPLFVYWPDVDPEDYEDNDDMESCLYWDERDTWENIEAALKDYNRELYFHKIELRSGYYQSFQLYVEELDDPNDMDNEDCRYQFDLCRSKAIRKYNSEVRKVERIMREIAKSYGLVEVYMSAWFSNGEARYTRVGTTPRERIRQAVSPYGAA